MPAFRPCKTWLQPLSGIRARALQAAENALNPRYSVRLTFSRAVSALIELGFSPEKEKCNSKITFSASCFCCAVCSLSNSVILSKPRGAYATEGESKNPRAIAVSMPPQGILPMPFCSHREPIVQARRAEALRASIPRAPALKKEDTRRNAGCRLCSHSAAKLGELNLALLQSQRQPERRRREITTLRRAHAKP
jgi:hypothetical protein